MAVINLNQDDFQAQVLEVKDKVILVDFWAPWCGPCRVQGPILDELAQEVGDRAVFVKINVDENIDLSQQYGIMSIPALKVFKNGQLVEDLGGVHSKEQLLEVIEKHQ